MAETYEDPLTEKQKADIISSFILHSPPGEFNEVFNDSRVILGNDKLLKEDVSGAFAQYNKDQFTPVKIDSASNDQVLITEYSDIGNGRFFDPKSKQIFKYDHLRKEASDVAPADGSLVDRQAEPWRKAVEESISSYIKRHYKTGITSVYGTSDESTIKITICIESHNFSPRNYWNGRWRSHWAVSFSPSGGTAEITGTLKVQVHYYEDGNVQLVSSKEVKEALIITDETRTANELCKIVEDAENEYQIAITENYQVMSDTTFKALRRQLPITRNKIDWNKLSGYSLGAELKNA